MIPERPGTVETERTQVQLGDQLTLGSMHQMWKSSQWSDWLLKWSAGCATGLYHWPFSQWQPATCPPNVQLCLSGELNWTMMSCEYVPSLRREGLQGITRLSF